MEYSDSIINLFSNLSCVYKPSNQYEIIGGSGDLEIGEYINLYFCIEPNRNIADTKILSAQFSAIGSVMLIAAAEKLCSVANNKTFQNVLDYCDPEHGLLYELNAPIDRTHSVNFVTQAFYCAFENLCNQLIMDGQLRKKPHQ